MAVVSWVGPEVWSDGANGMLIYLSWVLHAASAGNWFKKLLRVEAQRARGHLGKGHNWWFLPCLISESVLTPPTALCTPLYFFLYVASPIVNTLCDLLECKLMAAGISVPLCHRRFSIKICQMKEQMVSLGPGGGNGFKTFSLAWALERAAGFPRAGGMESYGLIFFFFICPLGAGVFFLN